MRERAERLGGELGLSSEPEVEPSRGEGAVTMNDKIRILVAEDHLVARVGVSTIVNMQPDMTVVAEASNGQQAVELFRKHRPDVTLLDLRMPAWEGWKRPRPSGRSFPPRRWWR